MEEINASKPESGLKDPRRDRYKIIVLVLAVIFVAVLVGAFWDLYGRDLVCGGVRQNEVVGNNGPRGPGMPNGTGSDLGVGGSLGNQAMPVNPSGSGSQASTTTPSKDVSYSSYSQCLENAKDLGSSKDCCDCLSADVSVRKACRDAAAN